MNVPHDVTTPTTDSTVRARWRKSSASTPNGNCVEVAALPAGLVGIRNSRDPRGHLLVVTRSVFMHLLDHIRAGGLDDLADDEAPV